MCFFSDDWLLKIYPQKHLKLDCSFLALFRCSDILCYHSILTFFKFIHCVLHFFLLICSCVKDSKRSSNKSQSVGFLCFTLDCSDHYSLISRCLINILILLLQKMTCLYCVTKTKNLFHIVVSKICIKITPECLKLKFTFEVVANTKQ